MKYLDIFVKAFLAVLAALTVTTFWASVTYWTIESIMGPEFGAGRIIGTIIVSASTLAAFIAVAVEWLVERRWL